MLQTPAQLAAALAQLFADCAKSAVIDRGRFCIALAGGTTPRAAYELLAREPFSIDITWKDVFVYFSDERCVGPADEQSNYLMAKTSLLDRINIPPHNIHRMRGEDEPAAAAAAYEKTLVDDMGSFPRFDLIMLGMGADGHTASLFPGNSLGDAAALVAAPYVADFNAHRLTFTPRLINNARHVVVATQGVTKAQALADALEGPPNTDTLPVQSVHPTDGELTWMVDAAAASQLHS